MNILDKRHTYQLIYQSIPKYTGYNKHDIKKNPKIE